MHPGELPPRLRMPKPRHADLHVVHHRAQPLARRSRRSRRRRCHKAWSRRRRCHPRRKARKKACWRVMLQSSSRMDIGFLIVFYHGCIGSCPCIGCMPFGFVENTDSSASSTLNYTLLGTMPTSNLPFYQTLQLLGGSWDLVATYNWACNSTSNWVTNVRPLRETISRVIRPITSDY